MFNQDIPSASALIPKSHLAREIGVHTRTISRWIADESMNFPRPRLLRNRLYFSRAEIEAWKDAQIRVIAGNHPAQLYGAISENPR
jgi:predicted DNA-binding transcriptional regulator AlpA